MPQSACRLAIHGVVGTDTTPSMSRTRTGAELMASCYPRSMSLSRRSMVIGTAIAAYAPRLARAAGEQKVLRLQTRQIEVGGKAATRYGVVQSSGAFGLTLNEGDDLDVRIENALAQPSGLHWHGLTPPWRQDGVPYISRPPVPPCQSVD